MEILFMILTILLLIIASVLIYIKYLYWPLNTKFRILTLTKNEERRYRAEVYKPLVGWTAFIIHGINNVDISQTNNYYELSFSNAEKLIELYINIVDKSKEKIEATSYFPKNLNKNNV
jgi:hypothetical protein